MSIGYGLIGSAVKVDPKNGRRCRVADGWLMIGEFNIVMILGDISRFHTIMLDLWGNILTSRYFQQELSNDLFKRVTF